MAFFKFRKGGDEQPAPPAPSESIEALRRRAMHRLIGAAVLVVAGVIGFPLLFDSQPRPIAVDIPIEIPDRTKAKPLVVAATPPSNAAAPAAPAMAPAAPEVAPAVSAPVAAAEPKTLPVPKVEEKPAESSVKPVPEAVKAVPKAEPKVEAKSEAKTTDGAKAQALLENKATEKTAEKAPEKPASAAAEGRYVVQVGAFADATRARDARTKLEHAGLKTYTQVVDTKDGQRTRVRVGPFSDKSDAEKAAKKIKALDLPAAVLTL